MVHVWVGDTHVGDVRNPKPMLAETGSECLVGAVAGGARVDNSELGITDAVAVDGTDLEGSLYHNSSKTLHMRGWYNATITLPPARRWSNDDTVQNAAVRYSISCYSHGGAYGRSPITRTRPRGGGRTPCWSRRPLVGRDEWRQRRPQRFRDRPGRARRWFLPVPGPAGRPRLYQRWS